MKKFSKILSVALLVALVLSLGVASAFAASIEVKNVIDDEAYTAYKILNYEDNGKTGDARAVSYYLTDSEYTSIGAVLEAAGFEFTASSDGSRYTVSNGDTFDAAAAAQYLGAHVADLGNALGKFDTVGADGEAVFTGLTTGYFFVTSSAGSLCALHEDTDIATAVEKNTVPEIDKKERIAKGENPDNFVDGPINGKIGDTVNYQIVVTDGVGTDAELTVTDTLSDGLTYTAGSLKINGTAVADDADVEDNYKVTVAGQKITIVFDPAYVANLGTGETITITLDATINTSAVINNAGNDNKVELDYSNQHSEDIVKVKTYDFVVNKVDGENKYLAGAGFKLYDAAENGNQILLSKDDTGYYVDANGDPNLEIEVPETGANVRGLLPGDYYLEETTVPDGYNKLAAREKVTVVTDQTAAATITVENNKGTTLPSTGGIGTTIFYVVGGVLVLAAIILLVTKKRMSE